MQKFQNNIQDQFGNAVSSATVEVRLVVGGTLASLFSDNGVTPLANPFTAQDGSEFWFYAANSRYDIFISGPVTDSMLDVILYDSASAAGSNVIDGTADGQIPIWDETTDQQYEPSSALTISEDAAAGGNIYFTGFGTDFFHWYATDGGVVEVLEPAFALHNSRVLRLWPTGTASRPFIRGLSGSTYLEFSAENTAAMVNTGAIFRYPVSIGASKPAPTGILGDTNMLWSFQYNANGSPVLFTINEDQISYPIGAPGDLSYTFNTPTAAADPGTNFMRMDTADFSTATELYFDDISNANADEAWFFSKLNVGDLLSFTIGPDRGRWMRATVSSITDNTGWYTVGISVVDHAGTNFINADDVRIHVIPRSVMSPAAPIQLADNEELQFGTGNDVQFDFNGSNMVTVGPGGGAVWLISGFDQIRIPGALGINEAGSPDGNVAGVGQYWVESEGDNVPVFTSDAGTLHLLTPSRSDVNQQNGNYTLLLADLGKTISKVSGGAGETITIPAEASVAFKVGTFIGFNNDGGGDLTIAITTDTLIWAEDNSTGSRTLADGGYAVAQKVAVQTWKIAGNGIS